MLHYDLHQKIYSNINLVHQKSFSLLSEKHVFLQKKIGRQMLREKNDAIDVKLTNLIRQFSTRNFGKSCRFLCKKNIICRILLLSAPGEQNIYPLPLKRQMVDPLPFLRQCWHHTAWESFVAIYIVLLSYKLYIYIHPQRIKYVYFNIL